MSDLTILCITEGAPHAAPLIERMGQSADEMGATFALHDGSGRGCLENVLDEAIDECADGYILRLDDDEAMSPAMRQWLREGSYRAADHWAFPRLNLWPDAAHYIANPPLHPDLQTRLSVKAKSGGRREIHAGSPFGTGTIAPCAIEHHKFLIRSREEREALVLRYEAISEDAGREFVMFSVPEIYGEALRCLPV